MRNIFKNELKNLSDDNWMGLFIEDVATSDNLKLIPDDFAVLTKEGDQYFIIRSNKQKILFPLNHMIFTEQSQNDFFCNISCSDQYQQNIFPYTISPVYSGDNWYISSSGQKRFEWFLSWLKIETEEVHFHSDDEVLHNS